MAPSGTPAANPPAPRRHHYLFAHLRLRQLVLADDGAARFVAAAADPAFVTHLWARVAAEVPEVDRLPDTGLAVTLHDEKGRVAGGRRRAALAVVRLPRPEGNAECWFLGVRAGVPRMLTLEHTWSPVLEGWTTALGRWSGEGHEVIELGPDADEAGFATLAPTHLQP